MKKTNKAGLLGICIVMLLAVATSPLWQWWGKPVAIFTDNRFRAHRYLTWSGDDDKLLFPNEGKDICLLQLNDRSFEKIPAGSISRMVYSPERHYAVSLSTGSNRQVKLWQIVPNPKLLWQIENKSLSTGIAFCPNKKRTFFVYHKRTSRRSPSFPQPLSQFEIWSVDLASTKSKLFYKLQQPVGATPFPYLICSIDGSELIGYGNGLCYIWDCKSGRLKYTFPLGSTAPNMAVPLPNKRLLFACGGFSILWSGEKSAIIYRVAHLSWRGLDSVETALAANVKRNMFGVALTNGRLQLRRLSDGKLLSSHFYGEEIESLSFSSDGRSLALARGGRIEVYKVDQLIQ